MLLADWDALPEDAGTPGGRDLPIPHRFESKNMAKEAEVRFSVYEKKILC